MPFWFFTLDNIAISITASGITSKLGPHLNYIDAKLGKIRWN